MVSKKPILPEKEQKMSELEKVICLHQFVRPKSGFPKPGYGNCRTCKYDPDYNKKCKGYYPITVKTFDVE